MRSLYFYSYDFFKEWSALWTRLTYPHLLSFIIKNAYSFELQAFVDVNSSHLYSALEPPTVCYHRDIKYLEHLSSIKHSSFSKYAPPVFQSTSTSISFSTVSVGNLETFSATNTVITRKYLTVKSFMTSSIGIWKHFAVGDHGVNRPAKVL